jgi:hypothetical protein
MRKGRRTISRRITKKNNLLSRYYGKQWGARGGNGNFSREKPLLFPKNPLLLSSNSLIFQLIHTKSVFNSVINSQVMDCFSLLPTPLGLLNRI